MRILLTRSPELFSPRSISPDSKMGEQDSDNMTCVPGCLLQDKPCQVPLLKLRICIDTYLYSHTKGDIQKTKTGKIA